MLLPKSFFNRDTLTVAKELLWKKFVFVNRRWILLSGIINEVEAYKWSEDRASHANMWKTPRNSNMFDTYGHTYIYFIYGMYHCLNFTTEEIWTPWAVLIRWLIPLNGINEMKKNRKTTDTKNLTNWPWKICQAFSLNKTHDWLELSLQNKIYLEDTWYEIKTPIKNDYRIGINQGNDKKWRFYFG
jgi:DNA-3-methyladenine glycosylase